VIWLIVSLLFFVFGFLIVVIPSSIPVEVQILAVSTPFSAAAEMTESDVTAFLDPVKYRRNSENDDLSGRLGWPILIRRLFV